MGASELVLIMAVLCPMLCMANVGPPVFLFKDARVETTIGTPKAGHILSKEEFSKSLEKIKHSDLMITFIQDELSKEDFLRLDENMKRGGLCKNVETYAGMKSSIFFPAVKNPMHGLMEQAKSKFERKIGLDDPSEVLEELSKTDLQKDTVLIIHLRPTNVQNSNAAIKKNDELIGEVMAHVEKSGLTYAAFFTGQNFRRPEEEVVVQGFRRHLLATPANVTNQTSYFYNETGCLLFFDSMKVNGELVIEKPDLTCTYDNDTETTLVEFSNNVTMVYSKGNTTGMWYVSGATVEGEEVNELPDISAPIMFSYHCSTGIKFDVKTNESGVINTSVALEFRVIQIQVFEFKTEYKFGYAYDCTPFFTIPLWTGLLIAFFLLAVTTYGLMMLSSIQTFDQYDDPKGKPLTVTVSE